MGPNYVLDKGFNLSNGGAAQTIYRFMKLVTETTVTQQTAGTIFSIGVTQDRIDAADSATGNVQVNVRILGITKVEAGAAVALGARVMSDSQGRAVTGAGATSLQAGIALSAAAGAGEWIDVLLTPQFPALA